MKISGLLASVALALVALALITLTNGCSGRKGADSGGKVLRVVLEDSVKGVDPVSMYDIMGGEIVFQIYETPYQYDYFSEKPKLIPMLADGMPTLSKDGLTYTFKIKKGVRYQDDECFTATQGKGRELVASDFIYSWKRQADISNEPQGFWLFDGRIKGVNEFAAKFGKGRPAAEVMKDEVEGFKALNDHTIQIKLMKPFPQLTYALATSFAAPVPAECVAHYGKDFERHPVGTGPFKVQSYNPTSRIYMVRNENFRDERFPPLDRIAPKYREAAAPYAGKKLPIVDAIEFNILKEEQPRWLGFLAGRFDQIKIPKDNFSSAIRNRNEILPDLAAKGISLSVEPALGYYYLGINLKDPLLGSNKYLRQAIASALDAGMWLEKFKNGRGSVQTEVNPPVVPDRCGKPYRWSRDLARAKQLLAKAGYPDGKGLPPLRYDTRRTEVSEKQIAELVQRNLAEIGITVEVSVNQFPAYLDKSRKGNLQLSRGGFVMDYPDPENNYQLLYGPNKAPGPNESNFDHAEFNKLYEKVSIMRSGPARAKLICRMEEILQEEVPWAYGFYEDEYRLVNRRLKNYHTAELIYTKYKYMDVDDSLPKVVKR